MARPALALLLALLALLVLRPGPAAAVSVWNTATIDSTGSVGFYTSPALDATGRFSGPFFSARPRDSTAPSMGCRWTARCRKKYLTQRRKERQARKLPDLAFFA